TAGSRRLSPTWRGLLSRERWSKPESADLCGFPAPDALTEESELLLCPGCPIGRCKTVPVPRHWSAHRTRSGYDESLRASLGLWRESEAFLRRQQRRSLKTQQRLPRDLSELCGDLCREY